MTYQNHLFTNIKNNLQAEQSLVTEIESILSVSTNSAYRRIRGDTDLTFNESITLARHFGISLDEVIDSLNQESINFQFQQFDQANFGAYLNFIHEEFQSRLSFKKHITTLTAKDIPSFYFFLYPELLVFKAYYYARITWEENVFSALPFEYLKMARIIETLVGELKPMGKKIMESYVLFPSVEIWNEYTIDGHLQHIKYAWETGYFGNKEEALLILDRTQELVNHIRRQAENGKKLLAGNDKMGANYQMYYSEGMQLENTILTNWADLQKTFIIYNTGDYLITSNDIFCKRVEAYIENMKKRSGLISKVAEKSRSRLFKSMSKKIEEVKRQIEQE